METNNNKIFSGYQSCQLIKNCAAFQGQSPSPSLGLWSDCVSTPSHIQTPAQGLQFTADSPIRFYYCAYPSVILLVIGDRSPLHVRRSVRNKHRSPIRRTQLVTLMTYQTQLVTQMPYQTRSCLFLHSVRLCLHYVTLITTEQWVPGGSLPAYKAAGAWSTPLTSILSHTSSWRCA
jgi:hypothetical protein